MSDKKWYYNLNLKPQGPCSEEQIRHMILQGQIGPGDLLFNDEMQSWRAAGEWGCFEIRLFPAHQERSLTGEVDLGKKEWVLIRTEEGRAFQDGPYAVGEILSLLHKSQINSEALVWKTGLSGWVQLKERPEFQVLRSLDPI